jgi:flavin reductase (DIM6/NTAB) family NADH-FMN oxidoreductase RutF/DNA-binding GntR family transcriptional regulator
MAGSDMAHVKSAVDDGLDRELFREVIGHFMTGVTVITARAEDRDFGMTASAVSSLSLEPPMLLACLNNLSPTQSAITQSRAFAVNILAEGQHELARHFAQRSDDKFAGVDIRRGMGAIPLLVDALAVLECGVSDDVVGGTHRVFLARVRRAAARPGSPLAYFRGSFGRIELDLNAQALRVIRERVIMRRIPLDTPIEVPLLAHELQLPTTHVHQALLTLQAEGLVSRRAPDELVVTPVDRRMAQEAFRARTAIELGAAELTVGETSPEQLSTLRERVEATEGLIAGGHFVDIGAYIQANASLHEYLVSLAGSEALLQAYRLLSIPTLMARLFTQSDHADEDLIDEHRALVDAYEAGAIDRARSAIKAHARHAQALNDAVIVAGGGRI